jgi:hypothetical protein
MEKEKNRKEKRERKEARILNNALVYGRGNCPGEEELKGSPAFTRE